MTKVLITGHTSGIGKAILENCPSDYEVKAFLVQQDITLQKTFQMF